MEVLDRGVGVWSSIDERLEQSHGRETDRRLGREGERMEDGCERERRGEDGRQTPVSRAGSSSC